MGDSEPSNKVDVVANSLETEHALDSIEPANNDSINNHSSSDVHPQVQKDLKFLKSKFWADGQDDELDDDISVSFPGNQVSNDDSSFTKVLSKSQKKKLKKNRNKQAAQSDCRVTRSKAGPLNFAS